MNTIHLFDQSIECEERAECGLYSKSFPMSEVDTSDHFIKNQLSIVLDLIQLHANEHQSMRKKCIQSNH